MSEMITATGLWEKKSQTGNTYFVGRLGGMRVMVLVNSRRQSDNDPTHNLVFAPVEERKEGGGQPPNQNGYRNNQPGSNNQNPPF